MAGLAVSKKRKVAQFLNDQAPNGTSAKRNGKATINGKADWDEEQDYEQRARKGKKKSEKEGPQRLPIKTPEGRIIQVEADEDRLDQQAPGSNEEDASNDGELGDSDDGSEMQEIEPAKPKKSERQRLLEAKEELATLASSVNEEPEENYQQLRRIQELFDSETSLTIKKLILLTQVSIFRDIIPGYRIRPLTSEELAIKVTSDIKKLRNFEQSLVSSYKVYVDNLGRLSRTVGGQLCPIAISCTCTLLETVPHFNFRQELLKIVVERLSSRLIDDSFVKCRDTLEEFFRQDESGTGSLEAVRMIIKMLKAKDYFVNESVLNTFLSLRLLTELNVKASYDTIDEQAPKMKKKDRVPLTKKEKKARKELKAVDAQMREADAVVVYEEKERNQSETLKAVFLTYFRILKEKKPSLTGATLEGLARFAHLINVEFFSDIIGALRELVEDARKEAEGDEDEEEDDNSDSVQRERNLRREALLCIVSAFSLLADQANEAKGLVNIDLSFFTTYLYSVLLLLSLSPTIELSSKSLHLADPTSDETVEIPSSKVNKATEIEMLLRSLDVVFFKAPRGTGEISSARVAAFTKRISVAALQLPEKSCVTLLTSLQNLSKKHSRKVHPLFVSEDRVGDGTYDPFIDTPELSNALAGSAVYEHALLANHYSPKVREQSKLVLKSAASSR
ncbi:hypothetical protein H072_7970 [Dactylellina haptotyla CBS 200.50]|uniref:Nucleolar complex-associated protein 3 n=1 Tax=Dactylellina haptotyla (strain CBS 200.50) TaxID=1284197 RepID=S8A5U8_DACHA|nr:hypothetical protein H072_7970 [Dactylellina haptotyla CBS 200.50]